MSPFLLVFIQNQWKLPIYLEFNLGLHVATGKQDAHLRSWRAALQDHWQSSRL